MENKCVPFLGIEPKHHNLPTPLNNKERLFEKCYLFPHIFHAEPTSFVNSEMAALLLAFGAVICFVMVFWCIFFAIAKRKHLSTYLHDHMPHLPHYNHHPHHHQQQHPHHTLSRGSVPEHRNSQQISQGPVPHPYAFSAAAIPPPPNAAPAMLAQVHYQHHVSKDPMLHPVMAQLELRNSFPNESYHPPGWK